MCEIVVISVLVGLRLRSKPLCTQGFTFPPDAGYPFESAQDRFFLMESHYNNPIRSESDWEAAMAAQHLGPVVDNSGLKLMFTTALRKHDAGVVSIGKCFFSLPRERERE